MTLRRSQMMSDSHNEWSGVRMRKRLIDKIEKFLKSDDAKQNGFTNIADFVDYAVRHKLDSIELKRFEHFNFHDNVVRVLDRDIGKRGDFVEVFKKNNHLYCSHCQQTDCVHIKFLWIDIDMAKDFKRLGIKNPF